MPRGVKQQRLKQRKDGRYCCKYKGKQFIAQTEREALAMRERYKADLLRGDLVLPMEVSEYIEKWLPLYKSNVSAKCYADYKKQLDKLSAVIGQKLLANVSADDAAAVWKQFNGKSKSTVQRARMLYIALFDAAVENDYCRKNPFRSRVSQPPKAAAGSHRALTPEEIKLIENTPHKMQIPALIMLYAGLRRGEMLALTKKDIDLKNNVIHVKTAVRYYGNDPQEVKPKTAAGVRDVPIVTRLRPYLEKVTDRVAEWKKGETMTERAFRYAWETYIKALSAAAKKPVSIRTHDLRHTFCTMCVTAGVSLTQCMQWLGHADEKMILRVYDHVNKDRTNKSIQLLEKELKKGKKKA